MLHLARLHQTPLVLELGLVQRHQKVLLAGLLLVGRALALGVLLGPADGLRRLVLVAARLALLGHRHPLLLGRLAQPGRRLDLLRREAVVGVPRQSLLDLLLTLRRPVAQRLVQAGFHAQLLELLEVRRRENRRRRELLYPLHLGCGVLSVFVVLLLLPLLRVGSVLSCPALLRRGLGILVFRVIDVDPAARVVAVVRVDFPVFGLVAIFLLVFLVGAVLGETLGGALELALLLLPLGQQFDALDTPDRLLSEPLRLDLAAPQAHGCVLASVPLHQQVGADFSVERQETLGSHHGSLVLALAVLDKILQQRVGHRQGLSCADLTDGVETGGGHFGGGGFRDKLVGNLLDERLDRIRGHQAMRSLGQRGQVGGDGLLAGREELDEPRVQADDGELVETDQPRHQLQDKQLVLVRQLRLGVLQVLLEDVLGEALRVVQQVKGGEVERVRLRLAALLLVDLGDGLFVGVGLLLGLLVDADLMLHLVQVNLLLVAAVVVQLLALLVSAEEEPHGADDDLFVVGEGRLLHDVDGLGVGPDLALPQLARELHGPDGLGRGAVGCDEVVEDGLDGAVEGVVRGLGVRIAHLGEDLLEEERPQGLARRGNEDGEQRRQKGRRVDDLLLAQQRQASDNLLAQLGVQHLVVLQQDRLQVVGERDGVFRVQVHGVREEIDQVMERLDVLPRRGRRRDEKDLALALVLAPLLEEVLLVGLGVPADFVLQTRAVKVRN
ncbi:hypothetical protein CTA2_8583 [Colletotrichum tanaceti]|uniref:Uncharacterized protein n=1 Tax=Colletotrichum tanaceti TaxID=1306861 RepID=A0A4U6XST2_9PEZI|nr:hypothetical protein CTA2_8583 [Colletotrichum tanaceti]TKW58908.1 hypothetical protein CTA1_642 [Colletotrichum tanaceti]